MTRKPKRKLPRAPLPKQTGGAHKRKNKVLDRKRKHKATWTVLTWRYFGG